MKFEKFMPLVKGLAKKILLTRNYDKSTGGTSLSRYCYSVWLRHLITAHENGTGKIRGTVAELGPGDSPGIGFTALLTGTERYYALDVHQFWNTGRNIKIFDELVELLKNRTPIPDNNEFPRVTPHLKNYDFPRHILTDALLSDTLSKERVKKIRNEIYNLDIYPRENEMVKCAIPWDINSIEEGSVDFIFSQAVLEYVNDLDNTFAIMEKWLKPGAVMSHTVDLSSHGITKSWNGHWMFTEPEWKLIHGNNKIILNRAPRSSYISLNKNHHFEILNIIDYTKLSQLNSNDFSKKFMELPTEDTRTNVIVVLSRKLPVLSGFASEDIVSGKSEAAMNGRLL